MTSIAKPTGDGQTADTTTPIVHGSTHAARLEDAHRALLAETGERAHPFLKGAHRAAMRTYDGAGRGDAADRQAVGAYVAAAVVSLLAEGLLEESDGNAAVATLAEACDEPLEAARFELHRTASSSPLLIELPPLVACEIQLRLLQRLGVASEVSLWRTEEGIVEPVLSHRGRSREPPRPGDARRPYSAAEAA